MPNLVLKGEMSGQLNLWVFCERVHFPKESACQGFFDATQRNEFVNNLSSIDSWGGASGLGREGLSI